MCGGNEFSSICSKKREYVKGNRCTLDNKMLSVGKNVVFNNFQIIQH